MSMQNWCINNTPINTWNTLFTVAPNTDCCVFSYKIFNRGIGNANILLALTNDSLLALNSPTNISIAQTGESGSTEYSYKVSVINSRGETLPSQAVTIATGITTLSPVNYNTVSWDAVDGAVKYRVYGRIGGSEQLIGETTELSFVDDGSLTPMYAPQTVNTTNIKFRFLQVSLESLGMINSVSERIGMTSGDSLVFYTDNEFVDIIAFGDVLSIA